MTSRYPRSSSPVLLSLLLGLVGCLSDKLDTTDTSHVEDTVTDSSDTTDTSDTEDTGGDECGATEDLLFKSFSVVDGLNLEAQTLTITGGCFDSTLTLDLVQDLKGSKTSYELPLDSVSRESLTTTIPAGIPVGNYLVHGVRGRKDSTSSTNWSATSNIIVSGGYEGFYHVVDMADPAAPREILAFQPFSKDSTKAVSTPVVNYQGTRLFFADWESKSQMGVFAVNLFDGSGVSKITADTQAFYFDLDANPVDDTIVFRACEEVADVCSIHLLTGDGERILADVNETVLVNGDNTSSWGLWDPVWSPDGLQVAYIRETACEGSTEPECDSDFYTVVMVHDLDSGIGAPVYFETGAHNWSNLHWLMDGRLSWVVAGETSQELVVLEPEGDLTVMNPPGGTWDTEWNLGGSGFIWQAWSPWDEAIVQQPFNTLSLVHFPVDMDLTVSAGELVAVPDPSDPKLLLEHYSEFSWFGWRP